MKCVDNSRKSSRIAKLAWGNPCWMQAEVAELADALRSGRSGRKAVWVQLPASALTHRGGTKSRVSGIFCWRPAVIG